MENDHWGCSCCQCAGLDAEAVPLPLLHVGAECEGDVDPVLRVARPGRSRERAVTDDRESEALSRRATTYHERL